MKTSKEIANRITSTVDYVELTEYLYDNCSYFKNFIDNRIWKREFYSLDQDGSLACDYCEENGIDEDDMFKHEEEINDYLQEAFDYYIEDKDFLNDYLDTNGKHKIEFEEATMFSSFAENFSKWLFEIFGKFDMDKDGYHFQKINYLDFEPKLYFGNDRENDYYKSEEAPGMFVDVLRNYWINNVKDFSCFSAAKAV